MNLSTSITDLARHIGCFNESEESIAKALFRGTECGISFSVTECGRTVSVAGYAEGAGDAYCEPITLSFPFEMDEFWKAVARADQEGCDLFDEFHCWQCGAETDYEEPCEDCDVKVEGGAS